MPRHFANQCRLYHIEELLICMAILMCVLSLESFKNHIFDLAKFKTDSYPPEINDLYFCMQQSLKNQWFQSWNLVLVGQHLHFH